MATKEREPKRRLNAKQRSARKRAESGLCITCDNKPQTRGLCFRCNAAASAAITNGETTDQQLVEDGLRLPRKRLGRPAQSGMARALNQQKQRRAS